MENKREQNIKINILTRTSNRPVGFKRCYTSVKEQTYKNIKNIVSYDNDADLSYLNEFNVDKVNVTQLKQTKPIQETDAEGNLFAPYNLYCNTLLDQVEDGWILFLDDDDHLYHNKVLEEIVSNLQQNYDEDAMYVWQMRYPDGRVLPTNQQIGNQVIKKNYIGSPCFLFHSTYKNDVHWDAYKGSDFRFLQQLLKKTPKKVFIPKVMVQINNLGDYGKRNDISKKIKMPLVFYKNVFWFILPKYHTRLFGKLLFHKHTYQNVIKKLFGKKKQS